TGASAVFFGSAATTTFSVLSDNAITASAPAGTPGTVDVRVTTPSGISSIVTADHFTYTAVPAPTVSAVSPSSGSSGGGNEVTITGTGFLNVTALQFGNVSAS